MKKFGVICLAFVIALGSLGVAYASWSQNLAINGHVSTGTFDVVFDSFTAPAGSYGATFSATKTDNHNYTISCSNLYPSLDGTFAFVLKNTGTIPAKITDIKLDGVSALTKNKDLDGDTKTDITITVQDISTSTTLGVGASVTGHLKIHTWILSPDGNDATQLASGSFTIEIDTQQGT